MSFSYLNYLLLFTASLAPGASFANARTQAQMPASQIPAKLEGIGITEKLGATIHLDRYSFRNEQGQIVPLRSYFTSGRPVLLSFAYYNCPTLCGVVLNGILEGMKGMDWVAGKQYQALNISINPRETAELASAKKTSFVKALGKPEAAAGWHFLTGEDESIKALASEVGFGYRYDEAQQEYVHGAGIFVLTPEGKISRILYGVQYLPTDLKLSLLEASNGKVGTILDRILLFCYSYDPHLRKYSLVITRVMQAGALLTLIVLGAYLAIFWSRQRRNPDEPGEIYER